MKTFTENDGGRKLAGYSGEARDCVVRAISIATGRKYQLVHNELLKLGKSDPCHGVGRSVYAKYMRSLGWSWVPTMQIGSGCKVHLRAEELPKGRLVVRVSRHLVAVIDGVIHDTFDPAREGRRCVYGYFLDKS